MPSVISPLLAHAARLLKAGRPGDAIRPLRAAAAQAPADASIHHDLGFACLEAGQLWDAVAAFRNAVAINPRFTDAYFRMGLALETLGETCAAIVAYDRTTEILPSHTEAWFRAGALVYTLGHREEAIGCFRRAAATGPKTSFGRLGGVRACLAEDRAEEAERKLRQLVAREPDNAIAYDLLGNLLADAGRFDEAFSSFERAISLAPLMAGSYYDLVRCRRARAADTGLLPRLHAALATPGLDAAQRIRVQLALGKVADDFGDHSAAMKAFDAASALRNNIAPFDAAAFDAHVDRLISLFTPALFESARAAGNSDPAPILIVGMPRSGTTLIEQILSSHPQVAAGGEMNFWNERGGAWFAANPAGADGNDLAGMAADYIAVVRAIGPVAVRITDKMPFNFLWAGLINLALPHATILHCRRAAIDTALSIHQTHFNPHVAFPTGGAALVAYFRTYRRLTEHWRRVLPRERFVDVQYEDVTRAPEPEIRRIVVACGLDWNNACLHPETNPRIVKTASKWQARQPIYRDAVERWRRYEPWLGDLAGLQDEG